MPPPGRPPAAAGRGFAKSRSTNDRAREEESVYNTILTAQVAPKVRTYQAGPTSPAGGPAPKARMHADSSQISSVLNPVHGVRDAQLRQGQKPFDHAKSNVMAVKEASKFNALRKAAVDDQEQLQGGRISHNGVRSTSAPMRRPPPTPPSPAYGAQGRGEPERDFVAENRMGVGAPQRPGRANTKEDDALKYLNKRDYGRVPSYLLERKLEMAEQAAAADRAREQALVPPGMRLLPDEERLETLAILARNKADVERALQGLPIIIETPSAIRRKNELEQRLREIEDATKVFSRNKVLVHNDM